MSAIDSGDNAWMMTSTALVLMMSIPGVTLFYGGLVRSKNVLTQMNYCFMTVCEISVLWYLYGYSIAFCTNNMSVNSWNINSFWGTLAKGAMVGVNKESVHPLAGTISENVFCTFQLTFAAITIALIGGAFAERMKMSAVLIFNAFWLVLVYCPLAHMVWAGPGSFLGGNMGAIDYAGGLVVHVASGVAGLIVCFCLGKRKGYPRIPKAPHSLILTHIGVSLLWVGWFGFNAGSAVASNGMAGSAFLVTHSASALGALSWCIAEYVMHGKWSTMGMLSGAVAGLVVITPSSGWVGYWGSLCIGSLAGPWCLFISTWVKSKINKYDDALDAFGVHGAGGTLGAILVAFWSAPGVGSPQGFGTTTNYPDFIGTPMQWSHVGQQLGVQILSIAVAYVWVTIATIICMKVTDVIMQVIEQKTDGIVPSLMTLNCKACRSLEQHEIKGLDESYFGEQGYNFHLEDMKISMEIGPLRGSEGHGQGLYVRGTDGSQHPVNFPGSAEEQAKFAAALGSHGGNVVVKMGKDGIPVMSDESSAAQGALEVLSHSA